MTTVYFVTLVRHAAPPWMSHLDPLTAESGVVLLGWLVSVVLSLVLPWRWSLELSLVAVAFVEAAFAQLVSPLEFVLLVSSCHWSSALVSRALAVSAALLSSCLKLRSRGSLCCCSWRLVGSGR